MNKKDREIITIVVVFLFVLFFSFYAKTIGYSFVDFDDNRHVFFNEKILSANDVGDLKVFWNQSTEGLYIPVPYTIWGMLGLNKSYYADSIGLRTYMSPSFYHATNVLLHSINGLLVFLILIFLFKNQYLAAIFGSVLFVVHPFQVESVAWVSGLRDVIAGTGSLAAILGMILLDKKRHSIQTLIYLGSTLAFIIAILSKPSAIVVPIIMFIVFMFIKESQKRRWLVLPWLIFAVVISFITMNVQQNISGPSFLHRPLIAADAIGFYITKFIAPFDLSIPYMRSAGFVITEGWKELAWCIPIVFVLTMLIVRVKRTYWISGVIFIIAIAPVLGFVPFYNQIDSTVADRYMYLALLGPVIALTYWMSVNRHKFTLYIVSCCMLYFAIISFVQMGIWKNSQTLLEHSVEINPISVSVYERLGTTYERKGDIEKAAMAYRSRLVLNENCARCEIFLGMNAATRSEYNEASWHVWKGLSLFTTDGSVFDRLEIDVNMKPPKCPSERCTASIHNIYGLSRYKAGEYKLGAELLRKARDMHDSSARQQFHIGLELLEAWKKDHETQ